MDKAIHKHSRQNQGVPGRYSFWCPVHSRRPLKLVTRTRTKLAHHCPTPRVSHPPQSEHESSGPCGQRPQTPGAASLLSCISFGETARGEAACALVLTDARSHIDEVETRRGEGEEEDEGEEGAIGDPHHPLEYGHLPFPSQQLPLRSPAGLGSNVQALNFHERARNPETVAGSAPIREAPGRGPEDGRGF